MHIPGLLILPPPKLLRKLQQRSLHLTPHEHRLPTLPIRILEHRRINTHSAVK